MLLTEVARCPWPPSGSKWLRGDRSHGSGGQPPGFGDEKAALTQLSIASFNELRSVLPIKATKAATAYAESA
jgi:hypothetical protein